VRKIEEKRGKRKEAETQREARIAIFTFFFSMVGRVWMPLSCCLNFASGKTTGAGRTPLACQI
jgi:hypothetical protein